MARAPNLFERQSVLPVSAEALYRWHARAGAFERLTPPWQRLELVERQGSIRDGDRSVLRMRLAPLVWKRWVAVHRDHRENHGFSDVQEEGPFASFEHEHRFEETPEGGSVLVDRIHYRAPLGRIGALLGGGKICRDLERAFTYRHAVTRGDLAAHGLHASEARPLRVLVSGASGLMGSALVPYLTAGGHTVLRLVRGPARDGEAGWDPATGPLHIERWPAFDAIVHLAGENIAARRWNPAHRERIRASRVHATRVLALGLARAGRAPKVFVEASAVGFYGDRGDETLTEESGPGSGFLAQLAQDWEAAAAPLALAGSRVVALRFGAVLTPKGGALGALLTPFSLGLGGRIGSGRQHVAWLALDDALDIVLRALLDERMRGPVNAVAPEPVTNATLAATLGRVLGRPAFLPLPGWAARLLVGPMVKEVLLVSQRAVPARLLALGHTFRLGGLEHALRHLLGRQP